MSESAAGPSGPGTVVLELGPGVGALVLFTPAEMDGREIEISRADAASEAAAPEAAAPEAAALGAAAPGARRTHSQVRPRHMVSATKYAAVYPDLAAGSYTIWADSSRPAGQVVIVGGRITNWNWPV